MIRAFLVRFRPLFLPALIFFASIGLILAMRGWNSQPDASAALRAEVDSQYAAFQQARVETNEVLLQMQRRMVASEEMRDRLVELYDRSQLELTRTQQALTANNEALLRAQQSIQQLQSDYQSLAAGKLPVTPGPTEGSRGIEWSEESFRVAAEKEFTRKVDELRQLREQNEQVAGALRAASDYFDRLWRDYLDVRQAIVAVESLRIQAGGTRPELSKPTDLPVAKPEWGPEIKLAAAEEDMPPPLSLLVRQAWVVERINTRSAELIALQRRLSLVNKTIESVGKDALRSQHWLAQAQLELQRAEKSRP